MPKKFEITILHRQEEDKFIAKSFDKIEADSLLELASQFVVVIARLAEEVRELDQVREFENGKDFPF